MAVIEASISGILITLLKFIKPSHHYATHSSTTRMPKRHTNVALA